MANFPGGGGGGGGRFVTDLLCQIKRPFYVEIEF